MNDRIYRKGVGIIVINKEKKIFAGHRIDNPSFAWQMPQGGIDDDDDDVLSAAYRELAEETDIKSISLIAQSKDWIKYDIPDEIALKAFDGKYLGQIQKWFLMEFIGNDSEININTKDPEFDEWKWVNQEFLINNVVDFKTELYKKVFSEFSEFL